VGRLRSRRISRAAFHPGLPETPPPGWVPARGSWRGPEALGHRLAWQAGEVRQLRQGNVHAERARAVAIARDPGAKLGRQISGRDQALEQQRRIDIGGDDPRPYVPAIGQLYPRRLASVDQHLSDWRID
jgi:hypothetical protein